MTGFLMNGAKDGEYSTIYATHPAQPGIYAVTVYSDGTTLHENVSLWGVLPDGSLVAITLGGPEDLVRRRSTCIMFPDGRCQTDDTFYDCLADAVADLRKLATA